MVARTANPAITERELTAAFSSMPVVKPSAKPEDVITVNFVADGFVAFGKVWYRGEEVSVDRNSPWFKATVDSFTEESWLELDEDAQNAKYGQRYFRPGKWTGAGFDLDAKTITGEGFTEEEKATLKAKMGK